MISIDYSMVIVILNFILMLIVLNKLLYKPMQQFLKDRQESLKTEIIEAKEKNSEAEKLLQKRETELKESSEEIRNLNKKARMEAEQKALDILNSAREREKQIMKDTEEQVSHQKELAEQELQGRMAVMVSELTAKLLSKKMDSSQDQDLIDSIIKEGE